MRCPPRAPKGLLCMCFAQLFFGTALLVGGLLQTVSFGQDKPLGGKVQEQDVFQLTTELEFDGRKVSGQIHKFEIEGLLDLRVRNGDSAPESRYGVELTREGGRNKLVYTCREWKKATSEEWYAATTYDMAMESSFERTCGLLFALQKAQAPRLSFISQPRVGVGDLDLLPTDVLATMDSEPRKELEARAKRGLTVAKLVERGEAKLERREPNQIILTFAGLTQRFEEIGRADFNGDGIEDIMIFSGGRVVGGTMGYSDHLILTRRQPTGPFEILEAR